MAYTDGLPYKPTATEEKARKKVYDDLDVMLRERDRIYPEFNGPEGDRTARQYWDDSDRRLNGHTPSRTQQGKEDWQENFFNPVTRQKLNAIVAGVATTLPEFEYKAFNREGLMSLERAEVTKNLVKHSYYLSNPRLDMFWETWEAAAKGTVHVYEGYCYRKEKVKVVTGYDQTTGKVEYTTEEHITEDKPYTQIIPISELFIWDFYIPNIQDQPAIAWVTYFDKVQLKREFSKYPNYKYVKSSGTLSSLQSSAETYYYQKWSKRSERNQGKYEVIRYYNKAEDKYEIWVNGVPLLRAPLLWGKKQKRYPFAKSIYAPFSNSSFYYGKSFPSVVEGWQDITNTVWNSTLDNLYRSLNPAMLVGLVNKDLLDIEEEIVTQDNKIYVPDVDQVKPMPVRNVTAGDMQLLQLIARGMDLVSIDPSQQGATGRGVTAREILIADERARELKGIFFLFMEDLWLQKIRLRINTILTNYMQQKMEVIVGKDGASKLAPMKTVYNVPDVPFSDGSIGMLGVQVVDKKKDLPGITDIEATEDAMAESGINYKMVAMTSDYLDEWELDFSVIPETLENRSIAKQQALVAEKLQTMAAFFPEYLASNKDKAFSEFVETYGENLSEYNPPAPPPQMTPEGEPLFPEETPSPTPNAAPAI